MTYAVYCFISMYVKSLEDHRPDRVAVALDRVEPTFRHELTPTSKARRESALGILYEQMGVVREVLGVDWVVIVEECFRAEFDEVALQLFN
ncbi:MAG: hypothetical protein KTV16_15845 [Acidimicrobiia bacterium]|nr:hypothetical protein [Acidimicrobiia bacterium]